MGIATGLVVARGATGVGTAGEETVVGDTPNLAARLQALADPDCVLVGPTTHRLTSNFFEFSFLGERVIKGFRDPIPIWKVLGESTIESRFAAAHAATAGPIIGRERELAFLYDCWQRATRGDGHVVLVVGEAGMGKSRLLEALVERWDKSLTVCSAANARLTIATVFCFRSRSCCVTDWPSLKIFPRRKIWTASSKMLQSVRPGKTLVYAAAGGIA